jgi:hypothetical protein
VPELVLALLHLAYNGMIGARAGSTRVAAQRSVGAKRRKELSPVHSGLHDPLAAMNRHLRFTGSSIIFPERKS